MCDILSKSNIKYITPNSSWYIFLNFDNYKDKLNNIGCYSSYDLSLLLINKCGIINVAGESFNVKGLNIRLSFVDFTLNNDIFKENTVNIEDGVNISNMQKNLILMRVTVKRHLNIIF